MVIIKLSSAIVDSMMCLLICKYKPFWRELNVESLLLGWPLRFVVLLLFSDGPVYIYANISPSVKRVSYTHVGATKSCGPRVKEIHQFLGVERSSISLCRRSEQAQWFLRELIYSSDIHPQKHNPLNILNLSRFQNIVEYSNINIDNAH